ncbi:FAD-dependent monooxygenase [Mycolicibacterium psychrotolerans]|uniref:FAD-dependent monooxygenase n=1 Tax=Mycolicibacterium psychrotolerans TaxID=216929 RepID=A0A7I7MB31_9MYCO|nr:NAD(P)/FAD-dependent oxidoreductase [Mycolicibacterium psychrotolerans]BBX69478.1 FAD-dependent monooxygenase [Mycolicibacterium psychrotolerans]
MSPPAIAVVGAGVGGLTAAIALRAMGIDVEVFESAPAPRATGTALGIASNATKVLRSLGIDLTTDACCRVLEHFELRTASGALIRALPGTAITAALKHPFVSIHRNELIRTLSAAAGDTPIHYGTEVTEVAIEGRGVRATCIAAPDIRAAVLVGADGFRSTVRSMVAGDQTPIDYGYACWLATVRFAHPRMMPGYTGHYWGRGQRFGLIDIGGGMTYWWATKNMPAAQARDWGGGKEEILAMFDGWAPEVVETIDHTPAEALISVPGQDRPFLKKWGTGPVTLLGDAAHPMLTSRSQGASSAVEDGYILAEAMARVPDPVQALRTYENMRRSRTRMLVNSSRRLNRLEQAQNPVVCAARNLGMRWAPMRSVIGQTVRPMKFDLGWTQ